MEKDRLIQGMAEGGDFRIIAAQTTRTVETARQLLDLAPVATDALGRALTGSLLLARLLDKNVKHQYVTLRLEGDGPLGVRAKQATTAFPAGIALGARRQRCQGDGSHVAAQAHEHPAGFLVAARSRTMRSVLLKKSTTNAIGKQETLERLIADRSDGRQALAKLSV